MSKLGVYTLASQSITTALTASAFTPLTDLDGMTAVTLEFEFLGGTGGSTCSAKVQTSFDGGTTWRDVARADFANTPATKHANLSGLLSKAVSSYAALNADTVYDGVLGDQLRAVYTTTGTYTNTTFSVRATVR